MHGGRTGRRRRGLALTGRTAVALAVAAVGLAASNGHANDPTGLELTRENAAGASACPDVDVGGTAVRGGCRLTASSGAVDFTVLSVFGDNLLGTCSLHYTLAIGPTGEVAVSDLATLQTGRPSEGACGDIVQCRAHDPADGDSVPSATVPWRGSLRQTASGALVATLDTCFDTCVGRLRGEMRLRVATDERGRLLRMRPAPAAVGMSGLEVAATWNLDSDDSRVRVAQLD